MTVDCANDDVGATLVVALCSADAMNGGTQCANRATTRVAPTACNVGATVRPPGFAEFIIGPARGRTRWLNPSYGLGITKT